MLIPEELLSTAHNDTLRERLQRQPPWSDLPVLILTRPGTDSRSLGDAMGAFGNVTLLDRPLRVMTLVSAVRTALRSRQRQYEVREHLARRAQAEASLREADQRKDEFLATLGHELRNPLAPLLTAVQLLKAAARADETVARVCPVMERQISHLVRLVNDLLEVSRITRGLIDVRHEPVDVLFAVQSALDASRPLLDAARHTVTVDLPREAVPVRGDAVRLTQVFSNLLNNAAKYTTEGGHVLVHVTTADGRAVVTVRDDGIGIPADRLTSIFDMFTQVDRSSRLSQGGLGIGLTLVRSLVTLHGGTVEARSNGVGTGSEFVVSLPLLAVSPPRSADAAPPRHTLERRILIVDDNCDAADLLAELLAAHGAAIAVAHSGDAALELFESFRPDAVVLDVGMPYMDGYEVARRIRAMGDGDVLLVALTGWGQESDRLQSQAAGIDHHIVKPPDINVLRKLLAS
jgi:signal transduction histidine kinase